MGEPVIGITQVLQIFVDIKAFLTRRRLVPILNAPGKNYSQGYADGIGFAITSMAEVERQMREKMEKAIKDNIAEHNNNNGATDE